MKHQNPKKQSSISNYIQPNNGFVPLVVPNTRICNYTRTKNLFYLQLYSTKHYIYFYYPKYNLSSPLYFIHELLDANQTYHLSLTQPKSLN